MHRPSEVLMKLANQAINYRYLVDAVYEPCQGNRTANAYSVGSSRILKREHQVLPISTQMEIYAAVQADSSLAIVELQVIMDTGMLNPASQRTADAFQAAFMSLCEAGSYPYLDQCRTLSDQQLSIHEEILAGAIRRGTHPRRYP